MKPLTIDTEPKWVNLVPLFVEWIRHGKESQREFAISEIKKMAKVCDHVRQAQKRGVEMVRVAHKYKPKKERDSK